MNDEHFATIQNASVQPCAAPRQKRLKNTRISCKWPYQRRSSLGPPHLKIAEGTSDAQEVRTIAVYRLGDSESKKPMVRRRMRSVEVWNECSNTEQTQLPVKKATAGRTWSRSLYAVPWMFYDKLYWSNKALCHKLQSMCRYCNGNLLMKGQELIEMWSVKKLIRKQY